MKKYKGFPAQWYLATLVTGMGPFRAWMYLYNVLRIPVSFKSIKEIWVINSN